MPVCIPGVALQKCRFGRESEQESADVLVVVAPRLELLGDVAIDIGRCKMLVPVAMGKRREERGKYLIVLVRQPAGGWKIMADSWSADLAVNVSDTARKAS